MRTSIPLLVLAMTLLLAGRPVLASPEDEGQAAPFAFDLKDQPLESVLQRAREAKKLVFIDFFLPG